MSLPTVEAARARMLAAVVPLAAEDVALEDGLGRVLAVDILARRDQPPFAASAMDGWAVRAADGAARRAIVGESAAGRGFAGVVRPGEAARIFTGAPLPAGADAVVIQEDAARDGDAVIAPAIPAGRHVRAAGLDFRAGDRLLEAGVRLDPWRLALAAAAGAARLTVRRRPRFAVLSTGDELAAPGSDPAPHQVFDSNSTVLVALARLYGAEGSALPRAADDDAAIAASVDGAICDLLVVVGGASVGDHDRVKPALGRLGLSLGVEGVAVRPGKPTWFGRLARGTPVLGLPGNPASAVVCAELFLRPLARAFEGADPVPPMVAARLAEALPANGPREHWQRARLRRDGDGTVWVTAFADQDSSLVGVFAASDAFLRRPADVPAAMFGDIVDVLPLARG